MPIFLRIYGQFLGTHRWPDAPDKYWELALSHPHTFVLDAFIKTTRDRQVEFLDVAKDCGTALSHFLEDHSGSSCETLAFQLYTILTSMHFQVARAMVTEDGGCGAAYIPSSEEEEKGDLCSVG